MKCNFCNKTFSTKWNYSVHKETSKFCILSEKYEKLQNDYNIKKEENEKLQLINENLQLKYEKLKSNTTISSNNNNTVTNSNNNTVTNNTVTNSNNKITNKNKFYFLSPLNLKPEEFKNIIEYKFTDEYFNHGQTGMAKFVAENLLKDENKNLKYVCSDISRCTFNYKDDDGNIKKDPKAHNLLNLISDDMIEKSRKITIHKTRNLEVDHYEDQLKRENIYKINQENRKLKTKNSKFLKNLAILTSDYNPNNEIEFFLEDDDV
jgi:hypothetical protein